MLTNAERRERLARMVRVDLNAIDLAKDGDLLQEIAPGKYGNKLKLPGKRECIMSDAELSGDLKPDATNVNVQVNVLVMTAEQLKDIREKKQRAIALNRASLS